MNFDTLSNKISQYFQRFKEGITQYKSPATIGTVVLGSVLLFGSCSSGNAVENERQRIGRIVLKENIEQYEKVAKNIYTIDSLLKHNNIDGAKREIAKYKNEIWQSGLDLIEQTKTFKNHNVISNSEEEQLKKEINKYNEKIYQN